MKKPIDQPAVDVESDNAQWIAQPLVRQSNDGQSQPQPQQQQAGTSDSGSRQQQQSMPSVDELKGKWKQQVGAAKIAWGKLTEDELLKADGAHDKLSGLVQERYAVTRDEAEKQVKDFFAKHKAL